MTFRHTFPQLLNYKIAACITIDPWSNMLKIFTELPPDETCKGYSKDQGG